MNTSMLPVQTGLRLGLQLFNVHFILENTLTIDLQHEQDFDLPRKVNIGHFLTVPILSIDDQEPLLPKNVVAPYALYGSATPAVTLEPCFHEIVITSVSLHLNPVSPTRPAPDAVVKIEAAKAAHMLSTGGCTRRVLV